MSDSLCSHGLQPARLICPWVFPGKSTGVGCHFFLQGTFPTQESNPCLLHWEVILYCWATREAPIIWLHNIQNCSGIYLDIHILSGWNFPCIYERLDLNLGDLILSPDSNNYWLHDFRLFLPYFSSVKENEICDHQTGSFWMSNKTI